MNLLQMIIDIGWSEMATIKRESINVRDVLLGIDNVFEITNMNNSPLYRITLRTVNENWNDEGKSSTVTEDTIRQIIQGCYNMTRERVVWNDVYQQWQDEMSKKGSIFNLEAMGRDGKWIPYRGMWHDEAEVRAVAAKNSLSNGKPHRITCNWTTIAHYKDGKEVFLSDYE